MKTILWAALLSSVVFVTASACHDTPTEPPRPTPTVYPTQTPTATPTVTPTPLPPEPAGLYGVVCVSDAHTYCLVPPAAPPIVGARIILVQGPVTLQTVSAADGSYQFPVGGGLMGPGDCTISTIAPAGYVTLQDVRYQLKPGLNGPLRLQVWYGFFGP